MFCFYIWYVIIHVLYTNLIIQDKSVPVIYDGFPTDINI